MSLVQTVLNEYSGPFSNWAERHAFLLGLTLGVSVGKPPFSFVLAILSYLSGRNHWLYRETQHQPHYFLSGFLIGYEISARDGEQPVLAQHEGAVNYP